MKRISTVRRFVASSLALALFAISNLHCNRGPEGPGPLMRNGVPGDAIGCYTLYTGRGRLVDSTYKHAFPYVELDTAAIGATTQDSSPGILRIVRRTDSKARRQDSTTQWRIGGPMWWADSLNDSIRLMFSDGYGGAYFALAPRRGSSDTLVGRAENRWDFTRPTERRSARAIRRPCAAG